MTTDPTAPALWQYLVQWQPAIAAALAEHARALPDDWPARVFGVARTDAALTLPPGATGEQFPDRAPEIAPYDEIAPLDDCPACEEAEGNCRFHEGYAAGHHEVVQAQLDAVRVHPGMGLREFMRWQADVEEAEDRGQEPPVLPAPAVPVSSPPANRAALRETVVAALERDSVRCPLCPGTLILHTPSGARAHFAGAHADAVLPEPADRAAVRCSSCEHEARYHDVDGRCWFTVGQGVPERDAVCSCLLRRMADETPAAEAQPRRRCAHTDVVYGRCVRFLDDHDGECVHEHQPPAAAPPA